VAGAFTQRKRIPRNTPSVGQAGRRREAAAQEGVGYGLAEVEGEAGHSWAESGARPEFKKKFFLNFN
jgi:hypothetical protein